jgi:mycothiol synthase
MEFRLEAPSSMASDVDRLIASIEDRDGISPFSEVVLLALANGSGLGLRAELDGILSGYACAVKNPNGTGWTLEAVATNLDHFNSILGVMLDHMALWGLTDVVLWVHEPSMIPAPAKFELERTLHRMSRALDDLAIVSQSEYEIDGFRVGVDEEAWLSVNNRAFEGHPEQSGWTVADLEVLMAQPWFDPNGLRMLRIDDRLAAFHWTKLHPDTGDGPVGEVFVVAVDPDYRGRGIGRLVTLEGLGDIAVRQGARRAMLYVDEANVEGMALYGSLGFKSDQIHRAYRVAGSG